ncbi:NifB/NifX family molybdenum-iron cluster-binding protein [Candidatus Micrarchaeota archaeon]|nr:NifB/NifX family molybdenum-iron cluster-binding protein [Candidatus Micrarchaeota archaeon]
MIIAITSNGSGINGTVAEHFGRCTEFVIAELKKNKLITIKTVENPYFQNHEPGAVPKLISGTGAKILITGGAGPMAIEMLESMGIEVVCGASGKIKEVLNDYLGGKSKKGENSCEH